MTSDFIDIPLASGGGGVRFFPDELPHDHVDLIDVMRAEIPPLKTWRLCAIEYFKQGEDGAFQDILDDVVSSIEQGSVDQYAKSHQDNAEAIADINIAKAAKELWSMIKLKNQPPSNQNNELYESSLKRFIELERSVNKMNEFTWLIKGFVQIIQGDFKGAEDNFRQVYERATAQNINKKKYLFGSLIGKGLVDYHNKRYSSALDNFSKALIIKPDFDVSLKFVLALCFYRVGQLERAKLALERSLQLGVTIPQLILLALIELDNAKVADHERQFQCQQKFYDYLMIAYSLDKFNPVVLNLLANYTFDTWKTLQGLRSTQLTEATKIISSDTKLTSLVEVGSVMRIERKEYSVTNVSEAANSTTILLSHPIQNVDLPVEIVDLDIIDYKGARDFAQRSARHATVSLVRAESYYILGKISQAQKRFKLAYDFYKRSYYESTEMILAYFGEAQVVFALGDYATALELFEKIKTNSNVPDDRDTLAYIGLLRGVVRGELMELDALKEVAPGFAFEFELWLSQGQLRLKKQIDHPVGLKCLLSAESILRKKLMAVPFDLLLNISTLYQYQGKYKESKQYACFAMNTYDGPHVEMPRELLLHNDLESFYFQWSDTVGTAVQSSSDPHCFRIQLPVTHQHFLQVGTHIRINGVVWTIRSMVSKEEISADTLFGGALLMLNEPLNFQVKLPRNNFCDTTILCSYNFARALEEDWKLQAASAIYKLLIQLHPSFMDAYVRLSVIARSLNKIAESKSWLQKAKLCKEDNTDFDVMMSDLYLASNEPDKAKEILSSSYLKNRTDAQVLVANGNFYLDVFGRKKSDDGQLKLSYKYFHPALQEHIRNVYAAHGLGIVCALKGELTAGHSILEKIRQATSAKKTLSNLNLNLSYISLLQKRYTDADRHLHTLYRDLVLHSDTVDVGRCLSLMGVVQYHNHHQDESIRSALKCLHLNPTNFLMWYNVGVAALAVAKHDAQGSLFGRLDKVFTTLSGSQAFKSMDSSDVRLAQKLLHNKKRKYEQQDSIERDQA